MGSGTLVVRSIFLSAALAFGAQVAFAGPGMPWPQPHVAAMGPGMPWPQPHVRL